MIEGRNVLCFASNWFYDPTSKHHVMTLLSERNHVIWVNYHGSRRPQASTADVRAIASKLQQVVQGPRRISENMTVVTPLVLPIPGSALATKLNRRLLSKQIRSVLRDMPKRPLQLWSFAPDVDYLCGQFDEECVIYYCVDEFSAFAGYDRQAILEAERRLAVGADLVVTTSQTLYDSKRSLNKNTVLVTHGVDYEHFATATSETVSAPADVAELRRPILGFWGLLQDWLDVTLIAQVAAARPAWSVVLIGEAAVDVSGLANLPNVHLLGRRPYASLPGYAKAFDVGLIPFRDNELTRAVNPIKLREYLSAGLPVVSTPMPEVRRYEKLVHIAPDAASFVAACEKALTESSLGHRHARQTAMRDESWPSKVEALSAYVSSSTNMSYEADGGNGIIAMASQH
ncbi:MAG: glycosyltransferase [Phycisphaerales bacterium]|nr:glycosyltransferase [Phycisphaerales bacterium]